MNHKNKFAGFTLIETIIAIGLFSVLVAIGVGGFTTALRSERQAGSLLGAQSNVSLAVEQMAREIRTGYLFCHAPNDNQDISTGCEPAGQACSVTYSSYADPNAPGAGSSTENYDLPIWTCSALQFYNANSAQVTYSVVNGMLMRADSSENNGAAEAITNGNVTIKYFKVIMFGNTEGDNWPPRITLALGVAASSSDPVLENNVLNLQTTISARLIDCTTASSTPQC